MIFSAAPHLRQCSTEAQRCRQGRRNFSVGKRLWYLWSRLTPDLQKISHFMDSAITFVYERSYFGSDNASCVINDE